MTSNTFLQFNCPVKIMFGNDEDGWQEVGVATSSEEAHKPMTEFLKETLPKFQVYYWRGWMTPDGCQMRDFGSHVNFFKLQPLYH